MCGRLVLRSVWHRCRVITSLDAESLGDCVSLYVDTFNAPPWDESWTTDDASLRLNDFLATPRSTGLCLWGADRGGDLQGFVLGHLERSGADDHFLIQEMCVRRTLQRQGYGTRLLKALAEALPTVNHWYLLTARDSEASAFYEKNGFRPARRQGVFVRT
ncbi:GNAT family N-acetyltransferase [Nocardioides perillae]|uniref:GNAT family N-acetyltransferase n=1 Tax=Nocardioides perillae TaxID=1119534 RepID=UPI003CCD6B6A